ncbi:MAG: serine/threonine protein kinase [Deltaproteobacteria bacterium]|nr:serine/threonine protein kinase [Kofleriaceae bacterium]
MFAPGTVIAQKYWVERVLGEGGMGVVMAATHLQLGQRVALKFLRPEAMKDAETVERFLREARAVVRLRSEHVCRVLDVGSENGAPFIVMEHLEGHDLATLVRQGGAMRVPLAADHVVQACLGLAEAHAAGIVHRDLKPSNLFLTRRPEGTALVKVMDFGIAKAHGRMDARLTDSAAIMGSPSYMAPEQLKSARDVDARADVWSLGVVLFELITARRPFDADSIAEIAAKVTLDPPAPLPLTLPRGFAELVLRCLEKDPARRFPSVGALAQALAPYGSPGARSIAAHAVELAGSGPHVTDPLARVMGATTQPRWKSVFSTRTRRRRALLAAAGVLVLASSVALALVLSSDSDPDSGSGSGSDSDPGSGSNSDPGSGSGSVTGPETGSAPVVVPVPDAAPASDATVAPDAAVPVDAARSTSRDRDRTRDRDRDRTPPPIDAGGAPPKPAIDAGRFIDPEDTNGDGIPDLR